MKRAVYLCIEDKNSFVLFLSFADHFIEVFSEGFVFVSVLASTFWYDLWKFSEYFDCGLLFVDGLLDYGEDVLVCYFFIL